MTINFNGHEVELPIGAILIPSARAYDFVSYLGWTIYSLDSGDFIIENDDGGQMIGPFSFDEAVSRIKTATHDLT